MEEKNDHDVSRESSELAAGVLESFDGMDDDVIINAIIRLAAAVLITGAVSRESLFSAIDVFTGLIAN